MPKFNRALVIVIAFLILMTLGIFAYLKYRPKDSVATDTTTQETVGTTTSAPETTVTETTQTPEIPVTFSLKVPFIVQAPFANWDARHEEACEEASLLIVRYYRTGTPVADLNAGDADISALIDWEETHGYDVSITLRQLAQIAADFYGMKTSEIIINPTIDELKKEIANGHPIIVPAAGKLLNNPNFKNGGPNYHMLVIRGYDGANFITSDPGTRKGDGYVYPYDVLMSAIHDWDPENITNGRKAVLVFD